MVIMEGRLGRPRKGLGVFLIVLGKKEREHRSGLEVDHSTERESTLWLSHTNQSTPLNIDPKLVGDGWALAGLDFQGSPLPSHARSFSLAMPRCFQHFPPSWGSGGHGRQPFYALFKKVIVLTTLEVMALFCSAY